MYSKELCEASRQLRAKSASLRDEISKTRELLSKINIKRSDGVTYIVVKESQENKIRLRKIDAFSEIVVRDGVVILLDGIPANTEKFSASTILDVIDSSETAKMLYYLNSSKYNEIYNSNSIINKLLNEKKENK